MVSCKNWASWYFQFWWNLREFHENDVFAKMEASQKWVKPVVSLTIWEGSACGAKTRKFCKGYVIFTKFHLTLAFCTMKGKVAMLPCHQARFRFSLKNSNSYGIIKGNSSTSPICVKTLDLCRNHDFPWNFTEFHHIPRSSIEFHIFPWAFMHLRGPQPLWNLKYLSEINCSGRGWRAWWRRGQREWNLG